MLSSSTLGQESTSALQMSASLTDTSATLTFLNYMNSMSENDRKRSHDTHRDQARPRGLQDIQAKTHPGISKDKFVHAYQANNDNPVVNSYGYTNFDSAFASMAHTAFADHKTITLRPDDIHLLIVQGITNFLQQYPEDFRNTFVNFSGKQDVKVFIGPNDINDPDTWEWLPKGFAGIIRQLIKTPATADLLLQDYSQTTAMDRTVKAITLMGTFSAYLNYSVHTMCHIPQYILQGTEDDWRKLSEIPQQLISQLQLTAPQDGSKPNGMQLLHRWLTRLSPVLQNMYLGRTGKADPDFWNSFYKFKSTSGGDRVTGNIAYFYPFLKMGEGFGEQKDLNPFIMGDTVHLGDPKSPYNGPSTDQLTANIVTVDFKLEHNLKTYDMGMQAGIVAHSEDPNAADKSLHTHVDYSMFYKNNVPEDAKLVGRHVDEIAAEIRAKKSSAVEVEPADKKAKKTIRFELTIDEMNAGAENKKELTAHVPPITARNDVLYAIFKKGFFSKADPASELLQYVILADWEKVAAIVNANPELMLAQGTAVDVTTKSIAMSPLQYAYYVHDKYMQDIFESCANKLKAKDEYQKQILEQKASFDLAPMKQAYELFLKLAALYNEEYYKDRSKSSQAFEDSCQMGIHVLGGAQCNLMPRHMLKQLCAGDHYKHQGPYKWSPNAKFDGPMPTGSNYVLDLFLDKQRKGEDTSKLEKTSFDELLTREYAKLGVRSAVERGEFLIPQFNSYFHERSIYIDLQTLEHLAEVRLEQQQERVARMQQAHDHKLSII